MNVRRQQKKKDGDKYKNIQTNKKKDGGNREKID